VICITHLPQIAAPAKAHYVALKSLESGRAGAQVKRLTGEQREQEIARLLDGSVSAVSLDHARALLAEFASQTLTKRKGRKK